MKFVDQQMRIFKCISLYEAFAQNRILQEKEHNVQLYAETKVYDRASHTWVYIYSSVTLRL